MPPAENNFSLGLIWFANYEFVSANHGNGWSKAEHIGHVSACWKAMRVMRRKRATGA